MLLSLPFRSLLIGLHSLFFILLCFFSLHWSTSLWMQPFFSFIDVRNRDYTLFPNIRFSFWNTRCCACTLLHLNEHLNWNWEIWIFWALIAWSVRNSLDMFIDPNHLSLINFTYFVSVNLLKKTIIWKKNRKNVSRLSNVDNEWLNNLANKKILIKSKYLKYSFSR